MEECSQRLGSLNNVVEVGFSAELDLISYATGIGLRFQETLKMNIAI